ncbi:hypothetical protein NPJ82_10310 [Sphingomonas sp. NY01]|uniref:hypothetical protein n=1 Tax=Sphingomonas sp. NY01 TaxID=2968057 RepID=UPI00315CD4BB
MATTPTNIVPTGPSGYERAIVTFIDILGFRHLLASRDAGQILEVLNLLRNYTRGDGHEEPISNRLEELRLYSQSFSESVSDAVVRVRTTETQSRDGPFLYEMLNLMHAQIECLNRGILIRGGLTIGQVHVGLDGSGPVFGPAMVRAYEIEQSEAVYPRITIDEAAVEAFLNDPSLWQEEQFDGNDLEMARRYIAVGEDGSYFLDYLAAADAGEFDDGEIGRFSFLERHRELIETELRSVTGKERRKLIWLANYHNRFVAELRTRYDMSDASGEFAALLEVAPAELFDRLQIDGSWLRFGDRLANLVQP